MAINAGLDDSTILDDPLAPGEGIDFKNKTRVNMFDTGIIDPFKVVRLALESAAAIAMSLVSKEVAIVEEEEPSKDER